MWIYVANDTWVDTILLPQWLTVGQVSLSMSV